MFPPNAAGQLKQNFKLHNHLKIKLIKKVFLQCFYISSTLMDNNLNDNCGSIEWDD